MTLVDKYGGDTGQYNYNIVVYYMYNVFEVSVS